MPLLVDSDAFCKLGIADLLPTNRTRSRVLSVTLSLASFREAGRGWP